MLLHQLRDVPGFASGLLHAVTNASISSAAHLMATLTLQKVAMNRWDIEAGKKGGLDAADRATVRENVLPVRSGSIRAARCHDRLRIGLIVRMPGRRSILRCPSRRS